jgi:cytosine/adenosine deaminase-related metal-dependent hydrolase
LLHLRLLKTLRSRIVLPLVAPAIEDGVVHVAGDKIVAVDRARDLAGGQVEDLGDSVLVPGLINAHCHLDFTVMRGAILQHDNFSNWVRRINDLKRTLSDDDYLQSISDGFAELRQWGTTGVFNIESFPELMVRMPPPPIRAWWFYELIDIRTRIHTEELVVGALTFFERHPNWMGGFGLSPHSPYTASSRLYELTRFCCEKYAMPWTTHLAETEEEFEMFLRASGPLYEFLKDLGRAMHDVGGITPVARLLRDQAVPKSGILAHMNCLADSDYRLLASRAKDVTVVHCPKCHEYFGREPFDLDRFRSLGISVCLGTDSLASNTSLNLFEEMRLLRRNFPHISSQEIVDMVTRRPARAIGLTGQLGEIAPGAFADLIMVPYSGPVDHVFDALIDYSSPIKWMMVGGRVQRT